MDLSEKVLSRSVIRLWKTICLNFVKAHGMKRPLGNSKYWSVEYSSLCVKKHVGDIGERIPLKVKVSIVMSS